MSLYLTTIPDYSQMRENGVYYEKNVFHFKDLHVLLNYSFLDNSKFFKTADNKNVFFTSKPTRWIRPGQRVHIFIAEHRELNTTMIAGLIWFIRSAGSIDGVKITIHIPKSNEHTYETMTRRLMGLIDDIHCRIFLEDDATITSFAIERRSDKYLHVYYTCFNEVLTKIASKTWKDIWKV